MRTKLFKIGGLIGVSVRRVLVSLSEAYPFQELFGRIWANLRALTVPLRPVGESTG